MEFNFKEIIRNGAGFVSDERWNNDVCNLQRKNLVLSASTVKALDLAVGDKVNVMFDLTNNAIKLEKSNSISGWSLNKANKDGSRLSTYAGALLRAGSNKGWYSVVPGQVGTYTLTERTV